MLTRRSFVAATAAFWGASGERARAQEEISDYRLGAGDQLRITVFNQEDLTGPYVVTDRGVIAFPLIGEVPAAGLTLLELTSSIRERLASNYLRDPSVAVEILNYRPFYILGEVRNPGTYPYSANLSVRNAVATAGGFTYRANTRRVWIQRATDEREQPYRLETNVRVMPGDTIRIAERRF